MDNGKKLTNIKINEVLELLNSKGQNQDDAKLPKQPDRSDSLNKDEDTQRRADTQEPLAESSNNQRKAKAAAKSTYQKVKSKEENEVDQTKYKKIKVHPLNKSSFITS